MPRFGPIKRRELIHYLRVLDSEGFTDGQSLDDDIDDFDNSNSRGWIVSRSIDYPGNAYTGTQSAYIEKQNTAGYSLISLPVSVIPDVEYTVSAWIITSRSNFARIYGTAGGLDEGSMIASSSFHLGNSKWRQFSYSFTADSTQHMIILQVKDKIGSALFDNIEVTMQRYRRYCADCDSDPCLDKCESDCYRAEDSDGDGYQRQGTCTEYGGCDNLECAPGTTYTDECDPEGSVWLIEYVVDSSTGIQRCKAERKSCTSLYGSDYKCEGGRCVYSPPVPRLCNPDAEAACCNNQKSGYTPSIDAVNSYPWPECSQSNCYGLGGDINTCCGDDLNEYYIAMGGHESCCDKSTDLLDPNGKCCDSTNKNTCADFPSGCCPEVAPNLDECAIRGYVCEKTSFGSQPTPVVTSYSGLSRNQHFTPQVKMIFSNEMNPSAHTFKGYCECCWDSSNNRVGIQSCDLKTKSISSGGTLSCPINSFTAPTSHGTYKYKCTVCFGDESCPSLQA